MAARGGLWLQLHDLDPRAEEIQHLIQLMLSVGAHADLQLERVCRAGTWSIRF